MSLDQEFYLISRLPPYVFAEVNRMKMEAIAQGKDIIDLGMGNPDSPPPAHVVDVMCEATKNPKNHGYSMSKGIPGLRDALCDYYQNRFGVSLKAETETVVTLGSKEGLASLATAITKPGDVVMVPDPCYPIHRYGFIIAGASIWSLPNVVGETGLMERIAENVERCQPKPLAIVLNFPGNPTAETVDLDFYKEVVSYCRKKEIYIISDLAYSEIYFNPDAPPPSILQVDGAKDVAIEFTTVSKTYSMAGWRVGFAAGNKHLVGALTHVKSYIDYGSFTPIQIAAAAALTGPQDCVEGYRQLYKQRRDVLVAGLKDAGWDVPVPDASMFVWAPIPESHKTLGSLEFSKQLLQEAGVAVAPGIGFGPGGDGFVRIAMVQDEGRIKQACLNIKSYLKEPQY